MTRGLEVPPTTPAPEPVPEEPRPPTLKELVEAVKAARKAQHEAEAAVAVQEAKRALLVHVEAD